MAGIVEVEQLRCALCSALFIVCTACFRGQAYCTQECRAASARAIGRLANKLHQQSEEGRKDHRDRQRAYVARTNAAVAEVEEQQQIAAAETAARAACGSVTDAASTKLDFSMKCTAPIKVIVRRSLYVSPFVVDKRIPLRCCVCGVHGTHIVRRRSRAPP